MSENKINLVVPKEYNGTPIEVVLREGKASVANDRSTLQMAGKACRTD